MATAVTPPRKRDQPVALIFRSLPWASNALGIKRTPKYSTQYPQMINMNNPSTIDSGLHLTDQHSRRVKGDYVEFDGQTWYRITHCDAMPEFFMSPVSAGDHWMFLSSQGALTAGRKTPDSALFPYYASDKLSDTAAVTGSKTMIRVSRDGNSSFWEPFSGNDTSSAVTRNLYKNFLGNRVLFEEVHHELGLAFRYSWTFAQKFGFVRNTEIIAHGESAADISIVDGIQNVMPYGLDQQFQLRYSNLGDAYKKSERLADSNVGLYYLSSIPTDRAEPSEGLRTTVAWHTGLEKASVLLSTDQLNGFRKNLPLRQETDVRGHRGAYFVSTEFTLQPGHSRTPGQSRTLGQPQAKSWKIVADVNYSHADVAELHTLLREHRCMADRVDADVADNERRLLQIVSSTDGRQIGANKLRVQRHQSNTLFNVMRGGTPMRGYECCVNDFREHVANFNQNVLGRQEEFLAQLPSGIETRDLVERAAKTNDPDLLRIASEYMPLTFSRRHGDPTRPWNAFSITFLNEDGTESLGYEGNWRDIFQNWEALAVSYPDLCTNMICRFVNASTADGYNPYRITKDGIDWETIEPDDPWSNIGYWGDHQVIYLLKLLERSRMVDPKGLDQCLEARCFGYAQVPYRIRDYAQTCANPQETIDFDDVLESKIQSRVESVGADGKLMHDAAGNVIHVNLIEKLLVPVLVKITNLIPDGGVWMNTQRPEWNDANNALAGYGLSVVTTGYLRRYLAFLMQWFTEPGFADAIELSAEVAELLRQTTLALGEAVSVQDSLAEGTSMTPSQRRQIVDALSRVGSDYRQKLYDGGLTGETERVARQSFVSFFGHALNVVDRTLHSNRRTDGLYHSYNLLDLGEEDANVEHLQEMLEGQVSILSSGLLSPDQVVDVLDALRASAIYRADQASYMLYPDRRLPRFMEKNQICQERFKESQLLQQLVECGNQVIIQADLNGDVHFRGDFRNRADLETALECLAEDQAWKSLVDEEQQLVSDIFEHTFHHRNFTGRSGTFFGYEGLGSIYWHMVSKLALAVMENFIAANAQPETSPQTLLRLGDHYREIRDGIGVDKSPDHYGAFPSDPYSHTPENAGVKQPGMTGQVKEDILTRLAEIGVRIQNGSLSFDPVLFESAELLSQREVFHYIDIQDQTRSIELLPDSFAFTLCQVPIVYQTGAESKHVIHFSDGGVVEHEALTLSREDTRRLFQRRSEIVRVDVMLENLH